MLHIISEKYKAIQEGFTSSLRNFGTNTDLVDDASILHNLYNDIPEYFDNVDNFRLTNDKLLFRINKHNCYIKYNKLQTSLTLVMNNYTETIFDPSHEYSAYLDQVVKILNEYC